MAHNLFLDITTVFEGCKRNLVTSYKLAHYYFSCNFPDCNSTGWQLNGNSPEWRLGQIPPLEIPEIRAVLEDEIRLDDPDCLDLDLLEQNGEQSEQDASEDVAL